MIFLRHSEGVICEGHLKQLVNKILSFLGLHAHLLQSRREGHTKPFSTGSSRGVGRRCCVYNCKSDCLVWGELEDKRITGDLIAGSRQNPPYIRIQN